MHLTSGCRRQRKNQAAPRPERYVQNDSILFEKLNYKIPYIILGIALVAWDGSIIIDPIHFSSKFQYTWDFSEMKW